VASANEVAEETLSLARVVRTFGTEKEEVARSFFSIPFLFVSDPTLYYSLFHTQLSTGIIVMNS
jgi:hypothetical protein